MEYETIISPSGTVHYINPNVRAFGDFKYTERRTSWCNMHLREADAKPPSGIICEFCTKEIKAWERNHPAEQSEP